VDVERATSYPGASPAGSYVLANGRSFPLVDLGEDPLALEGMVVEEPVGERSGERLGLGELASRRNIDHDELTVGRTPVIGYGSNTSVRALARKFAQTSRDVLIPVLEGALRDFDVVFSAHVSSYGAVPATLQRSPGTTLRVFVLAMTDDQLEIMHPTEKPYRFVELTGLELTLGGSAVHELAVREPVLRSSAHTYISHNGATLIEGSETALSALTADGRRFPSHTELEILSWMRDQLAPESPIDRFILEQIGDPVVRRRRTEWLRDRSRPFMWEP
jgi:hypothetical protein